MKVIMHFVVLILISQSFIFEHSRATEPAVARVVVPYAWVQVSDPAAQKKAWQNFRKEHSRATHQLSKDERSAWKALKIKQSNDLKAWRVQERSQRRTFFDLHLSGPERRTYVQEYLVRKKAFEDKQQKEIQELRSLYIDKIKVLKQQYKDQELLFKKK